MATLTNTQISVTYVGLLKTSANTVLTSTAQQITDGDGNNSIMFLSTAGVGIGGSPASGKELDVTGNVLITGDLQVDNLNIDGNTISATSGVVTLANGAIATTQSASDNSTKIATTAYVDNQVTIQDLDFSGTSGTGSVDLDSQTFAITGSSNEIETTASGQGLEIGIVTNPTLSGNVTITGTGDNTISTPSTAKFLIQSSGANGNDVSLGLKSSDTTWLFKTNRGDQIGGNQGDLFIREDTAGVNAIIIETNNGNTTFAGDITATSKKFISTSSSSGDYVRLYAGSGTAQWDIYGSGENLRLSENSSGGGIFQVDSGATFGGLITTTSTSGIKIDTTGNAILELDGASGSTEAIIFRHSGTEVSRISHSNSTNLVFSTGSSVTTALTLDGSNQSATFTNDVTIDNSSPEFYLTPDSAKYSWMIAAQENVDQHFEITPSTTVGGTTFNAPALKINGADNAATFAGDVTLDNSGSGDRTLTISTTTGGDPIIVMNSDASNRSGLIRYQDNGTNIGRIEYVHNGDRIDFQAGSATGATMSIKNNAVGIGTTSASAPLNIAGNGGDGVAMLKLEATAGSQNFNWVSSVLYPNLAADKTIIKLFGKEQALNNQAYIGFKYAGDNSTSNQLTFGFYGNDFLVNLLANGNLGISQTNPTNHINSGSFFKPDSSGRFVTLNSANGSFVMLETSTTTDNDNAGGVYFTNTAGQSDAHKQIAGISCTYIKNTSNNALSGGQLEFFTKPNNAGSNKPRFTIGQTGEVSVVSALEGGQTLFNTKNANVATPAEQFFIEHNGADVAIGNKRGSLNIESATTFTGSVTVGSTTSPTSKLLLEDASSDSIVQIGFKNDAREYRLGVHGGLSDSFILFDNTASATRLTIDTSGNATFAGSLTITQNSGSLEFSNTGSGHGSITTGSSKDLNIGSASGNVFINNNTTFAANITAAGTLEIGTHSAFAIKLQKSDGTYQPFAATAGNHTYLYNNDAAGSYLFRNAADSSTLFELTNAGVATFANNVLLNGGTLFTDAITAYSGSSISVNAGSSHLAVTVNGSERMRIDSSGLARFTVDSGTASAIDIGFISSARTIRAIETGGGNARPLTILAQDFTFKDDSATRMTIDSSGDLTIKGGRIIVRESDDGNDAVKITRDADEGYVQLFSSGTQTIEIRGNGNSYLNGGNVGIGTTSPTNLLDIKSNGSSKGLDIHHSNGNMVAQLIHGGSGDEGQLKLYDSNSETVRISGENNVASFINSGNVGIGNTNPSGQLDILTSNETMIKLRNSDSTSGKDRDFKLDDNNKFEILDNSGTGVSLSQGSTSWSSESDERLKENIVELDSVLENIDNLRAVYIKVTNAGGGVESSALADCDLTISIFSGTYQTSPSTTYQLRKNEVANNNFVIFEIGELIRDYIEYSFSGTFGNNGLNVWVKTVVTPRNSAGTALDVITTNMLAFDGYGYFEEGFTTETQTNNNTTLSLSSFVGSTSVLMSNNTIFRENQEILKIPVLANLSVNSGADTLTGATTVNFKNGSSTITSITVGTAIDTTNTAIEYATSTTATLTSVDIVKGGSTETITIEEQPCNRFTNLPITFATLYS